eukprot:TRINITY_DN1533_c0_g1_i12.p1 TRINITY_DN1533_c0_g1~~TRINITY_DN1533_c0_g1_i12.p1  ORF type:complete len:809 (+),score=200.11 TRINITY_DN1533_c0_g1_i12:293-2428(+)
MARTGSGKTAAFLIPLLNKLESHKTKIGARALILSPTRELAVQTLGFCESLGKFTDLRYCLIIGGDGVEEQFSKLAANPDIIISTPGRLRHVLVEVEHFTLKSVEFLVFDEGDRLFEMGFVEDMKEIMSKVSPSRQTLIYSATLPEILAQFARAGLNNPKVIRLHTEHKLPEKLTTHFFLVGMEEKIPGLFFMIKDFIHSGKQILVFAATKHHVEYLHAVFSSLYPEPVSVAIYGRMDPSARKIHLAKFTKKKARVLFVTDLAARGLDIPILDVVINFDFPEKPKLFIHRVGRVARAGREGMAYSLITKLELPYLLDLCLFLGKRIPTFQSVDDGSNHVHEYEEDEVSLGILPRVLVESYQIDVLSTNQKSAEIQRLLQSMKNATNLYGKTKAPASTSSVKRVKESKFGNFIHPLFFSLLDQEEEERNKMVASLKTFRPPLTVFELKSGTNSNSLAAMEAKRKYHNEIIQRERQNDSIRTEKLQLPPTITTIPPPPTTTTAATTATSSSPPSTRRAKTRALIPPKPEKDFRDPKFFLSNRKENFHSEKGLELDVGIGNIEDMVMDMTPDDAESIFKKKNVMHWDRKSKKYVQISGKNENAKLVRNESGQLVSKKNIKKGKMYSDWVKKTKQEIGREGEEEGNTSLSLYQQEKMRRRFRHHTVQAAKDELKTAEQMRKTKREQEKKKMKSGLKRKRNSDDHKRQPKQKKARR